MPILFITIHTQGNTTREQDGDIAALEELFSLQNCLVMGGDMIEVIDIMHKIEWKVVISSSYVWL